jgi:thioredoxin reductase (NADPH)
MQQEPQLTACDVLVAGSGIAGLTAGLFAARHGRSTVVLGALPGGQLLSVSRVEDFPGFIEGVAGYDLCPIVQDQAMAAGAVFEVTELERLEETDGGWAATTADGRTISAKAVIVATGTEPGVLNVPGEERLAMHGISHCACCDGPLHRGRNVAVIGGGDSALLEALTLTEFAEQVFVVDREPSFWAQAVYRDRIASNPKIRVYAETVVEEILGEDGVAGLRLRVLPTGAESTLDISGLFVCVGGVARPRFLADLAVTDEHGHVETDATMRTALPGLFAAGAIRSNFSGQAVTAAGDGAAAAVAAHWYLEAGAGVPARAGDRPRPQPERTLDPNRSVGDELLSRSNRQ